MGGRGATSSTALTRTRQARPTLPKGGAALAGSGAQYDADTAAVADRVLGPTPASAWEPLTRTEGGLSTRIDRFSEDSGKLEVYGSMRTVDGARAGEFTATLSREGGQLVAKTDNLFMESSFQGRGAGAQLARQMEESYRRLGVSEVRLSAAQVGTYTWAKAGYSYDAATGARMESAFRGWLGRNGHDVGEASAALRGARALAESRHGKAFLLSDDAPNWQGVKKL